MSRFLITLWQPADYARAHRWIDAAPVGMRVEFKETKRSIPQNDRFWALLTDIASQKRWHGIKLLPEDWKLVFLDALKREVRIVPNLDGTGFVNLNSSSSDLSKEEMGDLMTIIEAWGAANGVVFHDGKDADGANNPAAVAA